MENVSFSYTAVKNGQSVKGTVEAPSKEEALRKIQELKDRGLAEIQIEAAQVSGDDGQERVESEERTLKELRPLWRVYLAKRVLGVLLAPVALVLAFVSREAGWFLLFCGVALMGAVDMWLYRLGRRYRITNRRITVETGIISKDRSEVEIGHIRSINFKQSVIERLLNYGQVLIGTSGTAGYEIVMKDVDDPSRIVEVIKKQQG